MHNDASVLNSNKLKYAIGLYGVIAATVYKLTIISDTILN